MSNAVKQFIAITVRISVLCVHHGISQFVQVIALLSESIGPS